MGLDACQIVQSIQHSNALDDGDKVLWDVTDDVIAAKGEGKDEINFIVKKASESKWGKVVYYSKEGAEDEGEPDFAPKLIMKRPKLEVQTTLTEVTTTGENFAEIPLIQSFMNHVVIAQAVTSNTASPFHARVTDVESNTFRVDIEQWDASGTSSVPEQVDYLVVEVGAIDDGYGDIIGEAGMILSDHTKTAVEFAIPYTTVPVVIARSQTANETTAIVTRVSDVTTDGSMSGSRSPPRQTGPTLWKRSATSLCHPG